MEKTEIKEYDLKIGLQKTGKNTLIMFGLPALLYILSQVDVLVPKDMLPFMLPLTGALSYFIKNYIENK